MKKFFLLTLACLAFRLEIYSQNADAGKDKVRCNDDEVEIGAMDDNPDLCFHWTASPADPSLSNVNSAKTKVKPTQTTTYTLSVTGKDFSGKTTDDVIVNVFKFKDILIKESTEAATFFNKDPGKVCMQGSFDFKVETDPIAIGSAKIKYDLYDLDFINEELTHGDGQTFTHKFTEDHADGDVRVRFWADQNGDSEPDDDECPVETEFEVDETNKNMVSVAHATTTGALTNASVDALFTSATAKLRLKDRADDWRCCAEVVRENNVTTWVPSALIPDEVLTEANMDAINDNVNARLKVVKRITWCSGPAAPGLVFEGCTRTGSENTVIVVDGSGADTWLHEIGHSLGLGHRPSTATGLASDINNLMYPIVNGTNNILNEDECDEFE